jgi:hypothetical protein
MGILSGAATHALVDRGEFERNCLARQSGFEFRPLINNGGDEAIVYSTLFVLGLACNYLPLEDRHLHLYFLRLSLSSCFASFQPS